MRDLSHADVGIGQQRLSGLDVIVREFGRTASRAANASRGCKTRLRALSNEAALEFRQRAKHVKNKSALSGRRVDGFRQAAKTDTLLLRLPDGFDQLFRRARRAVELSQHHRVATTCEFQCVAQD